MHTDQIIIENFITRHPTDAARILERLKIEETASLLNELSTDHAVAIFKQLERFTAVKCIEILEPEKSISIIEKLPLQIVSVFLRQVEEERREAILKAVSEKISFPLRRILSYPADSAGALTDPLVLTIPEDISVKDAQKLVLKYPEKAIYYVYIVNRNQVLTGVINLRELMLAGAGEKLITVMNSNVVQLLAELNFQAILNHPGWQEYHTLPVVNEDGILLGAIRYETLRRIERESKKNRLPRHVIAAGNALGELYKIGLSGLIHSATVPFKDMSPKK